MSKLNLKLKTYDELVLEISRLNIDKYLLEQKLEQKENIIKEVREYIQDNSAFLNDDEWEVFNKKEIYEILDKGE